MVPVTPEPEPEPRPGPITSPVIHRVVADIQDVKRPRAMSIADKLRQTLQIKVTEPEEKKSPPSELPAGFSVLEELKTEVPALARLKSPTPCCPISRVNTATKAPPVTPVG